MESKDGFFTQAWNGIMSLFDKNNPTPKDAGQKKPQSQQSTKVSSSQKKEDTDDALADLLDRKKSGISFNDVLSMLDMLSRQPHNYRGGQKVYTRK